LFDGFACVLPIIFYPVDNLAVACYLLFTSFRKLGLRTRFVGESGGKQGGV
jgi:hypothetical protein